MTEYSLHFSHLDGDTDIAPRTVEGATADQLAQEVHRHARGYLGSTRVDVHLDEDELTGEIVSHGKAVGAFQLSAVTAAEVEEHGPWLDELRHGYTLRDIDRLSSTAIRINAWYRNIDAEERLAAARCAIVDVLYSNTEAPSERTLFSAAVDAADKLTYSAGAAYGIPAGHGSQGAPRRPGFSAYWKTVAGGSAGFDTKVVEAVALWQILAQLTEQQRQTLIAFAADDERQAAADRLGVSVRTLARLLADSRRRFIELWFGDETPPAQPRNRTCPTGYRSKITESQLEQARDRLTVLRPGARGRGPLMAEIAAEYGIAPRTLNGLLKGRSQPARDELRAVAA